MSKPKPRVPFSTDYDDKLWWEYKDYSEAQVSAFEDYLKKNAKEIQTLITPDFFQTLSTLYKYLGLKPHPIMAEEPSYLSENALKPPSGIQAEENDKQPQQPQQLQQQHQEGVEQKSIFLLFQNVKVDLYSLRILQLLLPSYPNFVSLKFTNNSFTPQQVGLLHSILAAPNCPVSKLFFEWNPLKQSTFFQTLGSSALEFVILRSCEIDDQCIEALIKNFQDNPQTRVKYLELYNNQINKASSLKAIGDFIETYQKLEYLGLAKNGISSLEPAKDLLSRIGRKHLSAEELAAYREKEKEKETIIAKAIKNKRKVTDDMLPALDPLISLPDGTFAVLKNAQLKMLNLSMNAITEQDAELLEKFITQSPDDLQIVLNHNSFDPKYKDKLKKKYKKNVQI